MPWRPPRAAWALPLLALPLRDARPPDALLAVDDPAALIQGSVVLHHASSTSSSERSSQRSSGALSRWDPPEGGSTIGDIAPRILTEEAIEALRKSAEHYEEDEEASELSLSEATAETLAASIGVGLNRITQRLDIYLARITRVKDQLLEVVGKAKNGEDKFEVFERAMNETLDVAQQGSSTVAVVLRSSVSSTEANLESASQRDLASAMEDSLGNSLSQFEVMSQSAFLQAKEHVVGLSQDVEAASQRLTGLREALSTHRRQANALGHALYKQFQDVVAAVASLAEGGELGPVAAGRVRTAFHAVQESAAAAAWKFYLPAWELAQGVGAAAAQLGVKLEEPAVLSADEPLGGEIAILETSPIKPPSAEPVTRELDGVEELVESLLAKTLSARKELQAAVRGLGRGRAEGEAKSFEAAVAAALSAVEPEWKAVGQALARTAKSITQCLETAGHHDISVRLDSLFGDALSRSRLLSHVLDDPSELSASLDVFLQMQDVLAQSFFRTYHEFVNGLGPPPGGGVAAQTISLRRWSGQHYQRLLQRDGSSSKGMHFEVEGICAALGSGPPQPGGYPAQPTSFAETAAVRLDTADQDEDGEVARRMLRRVQEVAFGSVQQAAAISWKLHSAAWVLVSGIRKATVELLG